MAIQRDEARRVGVAFEVVEQAPEGCTCADCGFIKIGSVGLVGGHYVCSPWCARQVIEAGADYMPLGEDQDGRCSSCGVIGCLGECEQGRDVEPPCTGCEGGCLECRELDMRDEPTTAPEDAPEDAPAPGDARALLAGLVEGSRFEVMRRGWGWVLVRVSHVDWFTPGTGTLFEGEPVRRLYVERVTSDGSRGSSWEHDERDAVRLVEVGLFE
ncbi:MAG TPA: hypothetical protein VGK73_32315 [Polyangiaceae bacterium]